MQRNSNDDIQIIFGQLADQAYLMQNAVIGKFNIGFRQRVGYSAERRMSTNKDAEGKLLKSVCRAPHGTVQYSDYQFVFENCHGLVLRLIISETQDKTQYRRFYFRKYLSLYVYCALKQ